MAGNRNAETLWSPPHNLKPRGFLLPPLSLYVLSPAGTLGVRVRTHLDISSYACSIFFIGCTSVPSDILMECCGTPRRDSVLGKFRTGWGMKMVEWPGAQRPPEV